jgi:hypothetical protein
LIFIPVMLRNLNEYTIAYFQTLSWDGSENILEKGRCYGV